jgi:hypothetical protein
MSLTIYFTDPEITKRICVCSSCDNEHVHEFNETLFDRNITHNLANMADACGVYKCLWRPDENDIKTASQLIEPLENALKMILSDVGKFIKYNATNGWGTVEGFVMFLEDCLSAAKEYPLALITVCR